MAEEEDVKPTIFHKEEMIDDFIFDGEREMQADQEYHLDEGRHVRFREGETDEETMSADSPVPDDPVRDSEGMEAMAPNEAVECDALDDLNSSTCDPKVGDLPLKKFPSTLCYACNLCGRCFDEEVDLKTHKVIHKGKEPYKCDKCEYGCLRYFELELHQIISHNPKKMFGCDKCPYRTAHKGVLTRHKKKVHPKPKTYYCDECPFSTLQKCELPLHIFVEHILEPFRCDQCDYRCQEREGLEEHQRLTHQPKVHRIDRF